MTEGMMGRTSDTRMYAPRSESSHMFRANHEDESTPTGLEDARDKEARMDRKQKKKELEEKEDKKIRHIKVRRHHMGLDKPEETEDEEFKPRESPEEPTSPPGAGGFLTSLAAQAKGPGAAGGEMIQMSEPMEHAWSEILKSKRKTEKRRKTEERAKWRPSTGKFKRPRGGYTGRSGTSARAKLLSRNLPMGRKTGLMRPHLAVEMSHRGIASKQPMSKDPQAYGQWRGYQEQQNILGQVRPMSGARLPFAQVNMPRAPRPRLHPVRAPPIQPPRLRTPHLNRPKMPGMVTMSSDPVPDSNLLKARTNAYLVAEARLALRQMKELMREMRDKDRKKKSMGTPDTAGAASTLPKYPGNNPKQTTRPEGATEDETDARTFGLDPIGYLTGRGGNRA